MKKRMLQTGLVGSITALLTISGAWADPTSVGPNGIDSAGLTLSGGGALNGNGVFIGQVEQGRPARSRRGQCRTDAQDAQVLVVPCVDQHGVRLDLDDLVHEVQQGVGIDRGHRGGDHLDLTVRERGLEALGEHLRQAREAPVGEARRRRAA